MTSWEPPPGPPAGPPPPPRGFTADGPVPSDFGSAPAPPAWAGRPSPRPLSRLLVFGVLAAMVAAGIGGFAVTRALSDGTDGRAGPPIIEPTGPDTESDDPDAEVLRDLGVQQQDVGSNRSVIIIPDGTDHVDGVTLDLCEGTFPSETLRTARLQVADIDRNSNVALSTEAVLYRDPAALDQAFAELRRTRAACTTEEFLAPPDADWTDVDGVERLAYRFETRDAAGDPAVGASVYLRRGRVFLGVYFTDSEGPQPPVDGRTTVRGIVELMQERLADLPASVVNRGG